MVPAKSLSESRQDAHPIEREGPPATRRTPIDLQPVGQLHRDLGPAEKYLPAHGDGNKLSVQGSIGQVEGALPIVRGEG